jgi:hypothetical protein
MAHLLYFFGQCVLQDTSFRRAVEILGRHEKLRRIPGLEPEALQ